MPALILLTLFVCWFTPQRILKYHIRDQILFFTNQLNKMMLIPPYLMTLMILAFKYQILQKFTMLHANLEVLVRPAAAYYFSSFDYFEAQTLIYFILHFHRKTNPTLARAKAENKQKYTFFHNKRDKKISFANLVIMFFLLILVFITYQFSFRFVGLAGYVYDALTIDNLAKYNMLTMSKTSFCISALTCSCINQKTEEKKTISRCLCLRKQKNLKCRS